MNNLRKARKAARKTQAEIAKYVGISQNTYSYWENGKTKIDNESLLKLAEFFQTTVDYLLGADISTSKGISAPVLSRVRVGAAIEDAQDVIGYEEVAVETANAGEYFALRVRDDSMGPRFLAGDIAIVCKQSGIEDGDIVVALINGEDATIKKIKKVEGGILLMPTNTAYEPMFFDSKKMKDLPVEVIGKVVEVRIKLQKGNKNKGGE